MISFITKHWKPIAIATACAFLIMVGYSIAAYQYRSSIANYDKREAARMVEIATKDAEQNQLRGENNGLREANAQLSAKGEAQEAIIKERGGSIAIEQKKLEAIDVQLAKDEAILREPTSKCVRCRRFSDVALAQKLIDRPLSCKDECNGK